MTSIILPDYNSNIIRAMRSLTLEEKEVPQPAGNQVLIRIAAAPCNPSDIAFMRGVYNIKKPVPVTMGFEGSGLVTAAGPEPEAQRLVGKRVACFTQEEEDGTWAEYFTTDAGNCIELLDDVSDEQAAAFCVNPFTAWAMMDLARKKGAGAIIQNAATGQVGNFIRSMAAMEGIDVINLVRTEDQLASLRATGEKYVMDINDEDFNGRLREAAHDLEATIAFDAVGGELSGRMFNSMPHHGELVIYGGLSGQGPVGIDIMDLIFAGKMITGMNLGVWKEQLGQDRFREIAVQLQEMIIAGVIETRIQGIFKLDKVQEALTQYIRNMSDGKILFTPAP